MKILSELFYENISEFSRKCYNPKSTTQKELELYDIIRKQLSNELLELFDKYIDISQESFGKDLEEKYIQGLKTGILIGVEASNIEL